MERLYSPISGDQVRLLRIDHKTGNPLQYSLYTFLRRDSPRYVAISYTWGSAEHSAFRLSNIPTTESPPIKSIQANGYTLQITCNLFDLLTEIRDSGDVEAWYWIDAVCINQHDTKEKASQVERMGDVYSSASLVLIWLGKANDFTKKTIATLHQLESAFHRKNSDKDFFAALMNISYHTDVNLLRLLHLEDVTEMDWFALIAFFRRSWFFRVWTIQECAFATSAICMCGEHRISWHTIQNASKMLGITPFGESIMYHARLHFGHQTRLAPQLTELVRGLIAGRSPEDLVGSSIRSVFSRGGAGLRATELLTMIVANMSPFGATDPRDRVFAAVAIMRKLESSYGRLGMDINYESSHADVFTRLMTMHIVETRSLELLCKVQDRKRSTIADLPSWVIDFSIDSPAPFSTLGYDHFLSRDQLEATQGLDPLYSANKGTSGLFDGPKVRGNHLYLCGFTFGTVTHVGESWDELGSSLPFEKTSRMLLACPRIHLAERNQIDILWKIMTSNLRSMYGADTSNTDMRLAFSHYLMVASLVAVKGELERGGTVESCLRRFKFQDILARLDDTRSVPSRLTVLERCNRFGLNRPNLSADGRLFATGMAMKDLTIGPFNSVISTNMVERRPFLLDTGHLGLGPQSVRPGDLLCIVADGARTPLLMRQATNETNARHLVGEAYVHEIMFGEAVDQMEDRRLSWGRLCII